MDNVTKKLRCKKCGKVEATNKMNDDRFYCPKCGINLGCYLLKNAKDK